MNFIHIATGEYPLTECQIRRAKPLISFGKPFNPKGYAPVIKEAVSYDPNTQKLVPGEVVQQKGQYIELQTVVPLTEEEFNQRQPAEEDMDTLAVKKLLAKQMATMAIPEDEIDDFASLYPVFRVGEQVAAADRRQYDGVVWEVIQEHTTQIDWLPPNVPALWKRVYAPETIPVWAQPTGSHDAWPVGARVQWPEGGQIWESTIPANTTVPGENLEHGYWIAAG